MLSGQILNLCARFNFPLADRNASDSWLWDGRDLALWNQTPPFDGEVCPVRKLLDHDVLHELCHFLVAAPEQRDLPEFGLDWGIVFSYALGPKDGTYRDIHGNLLWTKDPHCARDMMRLVDQAEATIQEIAVQYLSVFIGQRYGISPLLQGDQDWDGCQSWEKYLAYKEEENWKDFPGMSGDARFRAITLFQKIQG